MSRNEDQAQKIKVESNFLRLVIIWRVLDSDFEIMINKLSAQNQAIFFSVKKFGCI